jgi:hypothetical protein
MRVAPARKGRAMSKQLFYERVGELTPSTVIATSWCANNNTKLKTKMKLTMMIIRLCPEPSTQGKHKNPRR